MATAAAPAAAAARGGGDGSRGRRAIAAPAAAAASGAAGSGAGVDQWQFWIDRGGTFTDIVGRAPGGGLRTAKMLSEEPSTGMPQWRAFARWRRRWAIPAGRVRCVKMGTTVATNALLERKGDRVLLLVNTGFRDALRIAGQSRPDIFARHIVLPEMLYEHVAELKGRLAVDGTEMEGLDDVQIAAVLADARAAGIDSVAIAFMHSYKYPEHEQRVAQACRAAGFAQVSASHEVSPVKLVSRGDTTVVDAYLSPILRRYVDTVASELSGVKLQFMMSSGGLTDAALFQGKDAILSGPAGGIVGSVRAAEAAGFKQLITFDMGGTSTDVAHYDGEYERAFETLVAGVRMRAPMMQIHTVAAGGGSICSFDGSRFTVGPESAEPTQGQPRTAAAARSPSLTATSCSASLCRSTSRRSSAPTTTRRSTGTPYSANSRRWQSGVAARARAMSPRVS